MLPFYDAAGMLDTVWYVTDGAGLDAEQQRLREAHPGDVVAGAEVDDRLSQLAPYGG